MNGEAPVQFGRYRVIDEIGRGAMGIVYRAKDPMLDRLVAIKTINVSADPVEREEFEPRFFQEARAAAGMNHPNIITVHDIGHEGDTVYMAMELLDGVELRSVLANERLPLARCMDIAAQVADGLAYAHERGVIHRDIKPGNIMISPGQPVKIMDFGIARLALSDVKTQTGVLLGSPKYMSPEQVSGNVVDRRSDIFSLGAVLFEMITGAPPFSAPEVNQLIYQISNLALRAPSQTNAEIPPVLDLIVAKAMAKDPLDRYQSAKDLADDLRAASGQAASPLRIEATAAVDFALTTSRTVMTGRISALTEPGYTLSTKFDSAGAIAEFLRPIEAAADARSPGVDAKGGRIRLASDWLILAAVLVTTFVISLLIAFT